MLRMTFRNAIVAVAALMATSIATADVLDTIMDKRVIRVGVAEFVPWTMRSSSGDLIGFEIDVAKKIAADMGVRPEFRVYDWNDIIPALQQGEIDVIAGGMAITPRRALQVTFSRPLAETGVSIAINSQKARDVTLLDQLDDERIVLTAVADTLAVSVSRTFLPNAKLRIVGTADEAESALLEGRAHAYLATVPEVNFLAIENPRSVYVPFREPLMASAEGLAVKRGEQELLNFLNAWVTAHRTDRWLQATRRYWFETMGWSSQLKR
jgi:polar amino acid transport system substrate-binding protein